MTDRELLEMAAKAAGLKLEWDKRGIAWCEAADGIWNPITDDGDALRLAVQLGIEIHPDREVRKVYTAFSVHRPHLIGLNTIEPFGDDEMAATRFAIVRAAAEIGKTQ